MDVIVHSTNASLIVAGHESKNLGKRAGPIFTREIAEILKK